MLIGIFELIDEKQQEHSAYQQYIDSLTDYWIARAGLAKAVGRALPSDIRIDSKAISTRQLFSGANVTENVDRSSHDTSHNHH